MSLSSCIQSAGALLSPGNKAALLAAYDEHIKTMPAADAEFKAVTDLYASIRAERIAEEGDGQPAAAISFARSPTKMESVNDVLDFLATGKIDMTLGDAVERGAWADAYVLAKDANERKGLLRRLGDNLIERFADSRLKVQRWIDGLPLSGLQRQRLEGGLRRSDTVRSALEDEVKTKFTSKMMSAITAAAKQTRMSTDEVKKAAGYWITARYAQEASAHLILKDRMALRDAQLSGDAVKIAEAQRNLADRVASVNGAIGAPKTRGVGGGMNNAEAAKAVADAEALVGRQLLDDIAQPIYDMMAWKKAQDIASGKVTQTAVNSWLNSPLYVPLTGDPRATVESDDVFSSGGQLNQEREYAMEGRKDSVADDGIDAAFTAVIKSINFAAMQDFKRELNNAYEDALAAGQDIGLKRGPVMGITRMGDDVVIYRDTAVAANGIEYTKAVSFKFDDRNIMDALRRDNEESLNALLKVVASPTRWYGRAVTHFMPLFAPINLVRDIWERSELLRTRQLFDANGAPIDVKKAARASIADVINRDVWRATIGKAFKTGGATPVRNELEEFIRLGGSSTTGDYLEKSAGALESSIRGDVGAGGLKHAAHKTVEAVERYNDAFEMVPSLAVYRALKAQGMAPKDAAAATLDLMNFRKRGTNMAAIRALYVFAQPAATGGYNMAKYLSTRTGKVRFATQVLLGTALYAMLKAAWGDDDDEEMGNKLDNLSNFTVERTIPFKIGDFVVKLPVGFGPPQLAWLTAGVVNRWSSGRYDTVDALGELSKGWAKSFAPISPSDMELSKRPVDFMAQTLTPTVLRPLFNIFSDQTAFGAPLTPEFKDKDKLKSAQAKRTTAVAYSEMAQQLHEMTGIDVYPDHIKALADGYLIGPMREIMSMTIESESRKLRGEPMRVPLVASFVDSLNDRQLLNSVYYRVRGEMEQGHREYQTLKDAGDPDGLITPEMADAERAYKRFEAAEKMIGMQRSALRRSKITDEDELAERTQEIEQRADSERRRLMVEYLGGN